jgi:hypothetical protein
MKLRPDHRILAATAVLAIGIPVTAATWVGQRTRALSAHLSEASGVTARVGGVDADLTGTIRLTDVALGELFAAESVEASVALESLLAGHVSADEIRVASPHIEVAIDRDGDSDLARVVRRLALAGPKKRTRGATKVRRIVVSSGTLTAQIAGVGEITADGVELVPDKGGVRVITGRLRLRGGAANVQGELVLARGAAEVALPDVQFGRVLGVAGKGQLHIGDETITLRDVALGRLSPAGNLEARGYLDDGGVARSLAAELSPPGHGRGFALALRGQRIPLAPLASVAPAALALTGAYASGELAMRREGEVTYLAAHGAITGLRLDHRTIAPEPIAVDATVGAKLTIRPEAVAVERATLGVGAARWSASGWLRRGSPTSAQLDVRLAPAPCMDLIQALPVAVRGPLDGIAMTGTFAARARLSIDLAAPSGEGVELETSLANRCEVVAEPPAADVATLGEPGDHTFPDGTRARVGAGEPSWFELRRMPGFLRSAFVSAEDARFFEHEGFDITQIARSLEIDLRDRRLARGGSTISQQLVKNSFLTRRRSFDRKVQEALLTWRLEARLDKQTILERYLNIVELGPHIYGLRAAADYWFGRSPRELDIKQAAFLAALTSEPTSMSRRIRRAGELDKDSAARVDIILRAMRRDGVISKDELDDYRNRPLHFAATALRHDG